MGVRLVPSRLRIMTHNFLEVSGQVDITRQHLDVQGI